MSFQDKRVMEKQCSSNYIDNPHDRVLLQTLDRVEHCTTTLEKEECGSTGDTFCVKDSDPS